jgi:hypothetical protein
MKRDNDPQLSTADIARSPEERVQDRRDIADDRGRDLDAPLREPALHDRPTPLFAENDVSDLHNRWSEVQTAFVDEPRKAVERADSLVAEVMKRLAESFAAERAALEGQWDRGDDVTTEDLRMTMQRYRSFFDRLLAV